MTTCTLKIRGHPLHRAHRAELDQAGESESHPSGAATVLHPCWGAWAHFEEWSVDPPACDRV